MQQYRVTFKPKKSSGLLMWLRYDVTARNAKEAERQAGVCLRREGYYDSTCFYKPKVEKWVAPKGTASPGDSAASAGDSRPHDEAEPELAVKDSVDHVTKVNALIDELEPGGANIRIEGLPGKEYHKCQGIGSTAMARAFLSPLHYKAHVGDKKTITPQLQAIFDFGSAVHCRVLEPHLFSDEFVCMPEGMQRRGKEYDALVKQNQNATLLPFDDFCKVELIANQLECDPKAQHALQSGNNEVSYFWRHPCGLVLKARIDSEIDTNIIDPDYCLVDLKTTKSANPFEFSRSMQSYGIQDALYRMVTGCNIPMLFVAIEKEPGFAFSFNQFNSEAAYTWSRVLDATINRLNKAIDTGIYTGYSAEINLVSIPRYLENQLRYVVNEYE